MLFDQTNAALSSASFWVPDYFSLSGWVEHAPFAFWLTEATKPHCFVELGTHYGYSYFAFCQAIKKLGLDTTTYAVDTWQGDEHAGFYDESVYKTVQAYNQQHYSNFSHLYRYTFDEAVSLFEDNSIDLLHIDGRHFYEDVKHDFFTWFPKLTKNAIVLFHDISEAGQGFGVGKFFDEISTDKQFFKFYHNHGLGILAVGKDVPEGLIPILRAPKEVADQIRTIYEILGSNLTRQHLLAERDAQIMGLNQAVAERDAQITGLNQAVAERDAQIAGLRNELDAIRRSKTWRIGRKVAKAFRLVFPYNGWFDNIYKSILKPPLKIMYRLLIKSVNNVHTKYNTGNYSILPMRSRMRKYFNFNLRKGPRACLEKLPQVERALPYSDAAAYAQWIQANEPTEMILQEQREDAFPYEPLISIIVPAFNTQESYLREMVESLLAQTYSRWELCLADGGSEEQFQIERILTEYAAVDKRIRYTMLGKNLGIAENTNAALQMAQGDYIGLLDHDDILAPFALYEMVKSINKHNQPDFLYSDEDKFVEAGQGRFEPYFKSGFSIDMLRSFNYIGHFSVIKQALFSKIGGFNHQFDGSQDYDVVLRVVENSEHIVHIPKILYHWRAHDASVALNPGSKLYAYEAGRQAIQHHLRRVGLPGIVLDGYFLGSYQIKYAITNHAKVSIVIPSWDHVGDLKKCIDSIVAKTTYSDYEIIVVENNSKDSRTFAYYEALQRQERITVVKWPQTGFNFSAIVNYGVQFAQGEYILLLNNDVEVITPDWLELMVMYLQRDDVGVVGAKMYYPDDTIQHGGVFIHPTGAAGCMSYGLTRSAIGYFGRANVVQNVSAVTGACLLVKKALYEEVGGFDEQVLKVAYNDVDFCLKIRMLNKLVVFTPFAELYHYESKSRGSDMTGENYKRWLSERDAFIKKWGDVLVHGDPYYNQILC